MYYTDGSSALKPEERYTYRDYKSWDSTIRYELIGGKAYMLAAPNVRHQKLSGMLFNIFTNYLEGKTCEAYYAPLDVRLSAPQYAPGEEDEDDESDEDVVQPDIIILCDQSKMYKDGCHGAPDFVLEISSPSNPDYDSITKLKLYLEAGVREYWIVDPYSRELIVYALRESSGVREYIAKAYGATDKVIVGILKDLTIDLAPLFVFDEAGKRVEKTERVEAEND
jgi:Uma2 family endonuclease